MVAPLRIFYSLVGLSLFVPVIAGLYTGRGGAPEVFASVIAGVSVAMAVRLATGGAGFGALSPNALGLLAAAAGFVCVAVARQLGPATGQASE